MAHVRNHVQVMLDQMKDKYAFSAGMGRICHGVMPDETDKKKRKYNKYIFFHVCNLFLVSDGAVSS